MSSRDKKAEEIIEETMQGIFDDLNRSKSMNEMDDSDDIPQKKSPNKKTPQREGARRRPSDHKKTSDKGTPGDRSASGRQGDPRRKASAKEVSSREASKEDIPHKKKPRKRHPDHADLSSGRNVSGMGRQKGSKDALDRPGKKRQRESEDS